MSTRPRRTPSLRLHKPTGQAVVRLDGRDYYLGKFGTPESEERYHRKVAEWLAQSTVDRVTQSSSQAVALSINEVMLAYWRHAETYYVKNGRPTDEQHCLRSAFRLLRRLYGTSPATDLGPLALKAVRQLMIESGLSRGVINGHVSRIRRMMRWAVENELLPVQVYQALCTVRDLPKGRSGVRETAPILPVDDATVEATLPFLPAVVADMVRFQRLTGARPEEVCLIRRQNLEITDDVWTYRPESHKTEHAGRERVVYIGPRAQEILRSYLVRDQGAYCFCPLESENHRNALRRQKRQSPMTPSQLARHVKGTSSRKPGDRYTTDSYRRAIHRGCDRAWPAPDDLSDEDRQKWQAIHRWSPNRLRHTAATSIRKKFGLEGAQVALGHASADVTQVYAERDGALALQIMREVG